LIRESFWLIVTIKEWNMRQLTKSPGEKIVKDIKRATRLAYATVNARLSGCVSMAG
jgi:hypothetical protein